MVDPSRNASPAIDRALAVSEVLDADILRGASVLAGGSGLGRRVDRLNVMEVPDILTWVKPREFLLTTAYPLREQPEGLAQLVADLDDAGLSGMGIKLGRYVDRLPDDMLATADARGFPIVALPEGVAFDEIFHEVLTTILNRQAARLERAERVHRAFLQIVLQGHGLREIVDNLAELIDGPAAIVARDGRLLATARCDEVEGFEDGVSYVDLRDDGRVWRGEREVATVAAPITAGPRLHGHVLALQGTGALTDDRLAVESASTVAALAMTLHAEVQAVESKYQSDLMHDLLTGRADDRDDMLRRAASFGWDLDRAMTAVVVRFDDPSDPVVPDELHRRPPLAAALRQAVLQRDPQAAIVRFGDEVVVLTRAFEDTRERGRAEAFCRALVAAATRVTGDSASAGLSRPVTDVAGIPAAYDQATTALRIARRIGGRGSSAHFDDLGVHRLLALIEDAGELRRFAAETLGELADDDEAHRDLRRTLTALLETNLNVAEAARRLHFHYNTLRYRIDKLERILGPFTTDARVRLDVQVALLILQMRHPDDDV
jgi:purine catabolism regulator